MSCYFVVIIDRVDLAKQGDNTLGSVRQFVCLSVELNSVSVDVIRMIKAHWMMLFPFILRISNKENVL